MSLENTVSKEGETLNSSGENHPPSGQDGHMSAPTVPLVSEASRSFVGVSSPEPAADSALDCDSPNNKTTHVKDEISCPSPEPVVTPAAPQEVVDQRLAIALAPMVANLGSTWINLIWKESPYGACNYCLEMAINTASISPPKDSGEVDGKVGESSENDEFIWQSIPVGSPRAHKVEGLEPGTQYCFRLRFQPSEMQPLTDLQILTPSACVNIVTPAAPPGPPGPATLVNRVKNALKLSWSPPERNGGSPVKLYRVFIYPPPLDFDLSGSDAENFVCVYTGATTTCRVSKLQPGFPYQIHVQATNAVGYGEFSEVALFSTAASVPVQPGSPTPIAVSQESITLGWEEPYGQGSSVSSYCIETSDGIQSNLNSWKFVAEIEELTYCVQGLKPGRTYRFRIKAQNEVGYSNYSAPIAAVTSPTTPDAVPKPIESVHTTTSITVAWGAVPWDGGAPVIAYELEFQAPWAGEAGKVWQPVYQGLSNECTVTQLRPGSAYRMRVRALNAVGAGEYSAAAEGNTRATAPCGPPEGFSVSARGSTALHLEWRPPLHDGGRPIKTYNVQMATLPESMPPHEEYVHMLEFKTVHSGSQLATSIEGLAPGLSSYVRVNAENCNGLSDWTKAILTSTRCAPPETPKPPGLMDAPKARMLALTWSTPHGNGSAISSYNVMMTRLGPLLSTAKSQSKVNIMELLGDPEERARGVSAERLEDQACSTLSEDIHDSAKSEGGDSSGGEEDPCIVGEPRELTFTTVYSGPDKFVEVQNLVPHSQYAFCLQAVNAEGCSEWSDWSAAKFSTTSAAPSAPQSLTVIGASQNHVSLQWGPPEFDNGAHVSTYTVEMASGSSTAKGTKGMKWDAVFTGPEQVCTVSDLDGGVRLSFRVRANSLAGTSPPSSACTAETVAGCPSQPGAPTCSGVTNMSIKLRWTPPTTDNGAAITGYTVYYALEGEDAPAKWSSLATNGPVCTLKVVRLQSLKAYKFCVQAVSTSGNSPLSDWTTATTLLAAPRAPCNLRATKDGPDCIEVFWEESPSDESCAPATSYMLEMSRLASHSNAASATDADSNAFRTVFSQDALSYKVTGLKPDSTYRFRVRANGGQKYGPGPASAVIYVSTELAPDKIDLMAGRLRERAHKKSKRKKAGEMDVDEMEESTVVTRGSTNVCSSQWGTFCDFKDKLLLAVGCVEWMSEERREKAVAEVVAERQRAAVALGTKTTLRPPKMKRWYDKVLKQAKHIAYLVTVMVLIFLVFFFLRSLVV